MVSINPFPSQQLFLELDEDQFPDAEELMEIMSNVHLNTNFQSLARELDIMEPKVRLLLLIIEKGEFPGMDPRCILRDV